MEILNLTAKTGNKETILKAINSLARENYIEIFSEYVLRGRNKKDLCDFEIGYLRDLDYNIGEFAKDLIRLEHSKKSADKLLDIIVDWGMSAPYSFESYMDNYELDVFIRETALPADVKFTLVKNFMISRLDAYCLSLEKTAADRAREQKKSQLESYERSIKHYQEQIEKLKEDLGL